MRKPDAQDAPDAPSDIERPASALDENTQRFRILLVDDDPAFIEALSENLDHEGYIPIHHPDSATALKWLLDGGQCDVILLDWYMPDVTGIAFLKRVRDAGINTPVIVLTGVNKEVVEDAALGCGAVDFIDKSRRLSILLKRMRLIVDGSKQEDAPIEALEVGELTLYPETCRARWQNQEVGLTICEFRIVQKLASRRGVDFTYRDIYDVVHGEGFWAGDGDDGFRINVRSLIKRIRQKFRAIDEEFELIENYPGYGYRWRGSDAAEVAIPRSPVRNPRDETLSDCAPCSPG
jgi:two-component system response regulator ChvI